MDRSGPTWIDDLLTQPSNQLQAVLQRARWLRHLDSALGEYLDAPLGRHCTLANVEHNIVTLHADSPAWSAKLRYRTPDLLEFLRNSHGLSELTQARIKVRPREASTSYPKEGATRLPAPSSELLRDVAASITDAKLRDALIKLSHRGEESGE